MSIVKKYGKNLTGFCRCNSGNISGLVLTIILIKFDKSFGKLQTGNLDSKTEMEVISILKTCVHKYGQTLVMITHDETIAQMADRVMIIEDGKVVR